MRNHHALGNTCRAAGKDAVHRVKVNNLTTDGCQRFFIRLSLFHFTVKESRACKLYLVKRLKVSFRGGYSSNGLADISNQAHPLKRHFAVDRHIEVTALHGSHRTHKTFNAAVNKHQHCTTYGAVRSLGYCRSNAFRLLNPLSEGKAQFIISQSCLVGQTTGGLLQVVKYIRYHYFFS